MPGFDYSQADALHSGAVLDLVERSTDLVITATSAASAQAYITGNPIIFNGNTRVCIDVQIPVANADGSNELLLNLWEDSTDLGRLANIDTTGCVTGAMIRTPAAGSHTYTVKGWKGSGSGKQFSAGASSASGPMTNAFYRVTVA